MFTTSTRPAPRGGKRPVHHVPPTPAYHSPAILLQHPREPGPGRLAHPLFGGQGEAGSGLDPHRLDRVVQQGGDDATSLSGGRRRQVVYRGVDQPLLVRSCLFEYTGNLRIGVTGQLEEGRGPDNGGVQPPDKSAPPRPSGRATGPGPESLHNGAGAFRHTLGLLLTERNRHAEPRPISRAPPKASRGGPGFITTWGCRANPWESTYSSLIERDER